MRTSGEPRSVYLNPSQAKLYSDYGKITDIYLSKMPIKLNATLNFPYFLHWKVYVEFEGTDDIIFFYNFKKNIIYMIYLTL